MERRVSDSNPNHRVTSGFRKSLDVLLHAALAPSSRALYERSWKKLVQFMALISLTPSLPISIPVILLFVAYLHGAKYSPASNTSILSAVSYFHKINMLPDPVNSFVVNKAIAGARSIATVADVRLPSTPVILNKLLAATRHVFSSAYKALMMRAMMVLAFKAYLRVGEMVPRIKGNFQGCLLYCDITVTADTVIILFRHFKHSDKHGPQTITIRGRTIENTDIQPIQVISQFMQARGTVAGTLFSFPDGTPLLRRDFNGALKSLLAFCGFDSSHFKGHSFRIGAATAAALRGELDAQIRDAGRWASDAFKRYIRIA